MTPLRSMLARLTGRASPAAIPIAAAPTTPILFIGDSITQLWAEHRPGLFADRGFVNRGVGGDTSSQVRKRLPPALADARPAGLHLLCGINDIAQDAVPDVDGAILANVAVMLTLARKRGVRAWLGSITPANQTFGSGDPRPRIIALNGRLRALAGRGAASFIDYHAALATPAGGLRPEYDEDGVHLSAAGYDAMAPVLFAALQNGS